MKHENAPRVPYGTCKTSAREAETGAFLGLAGQLAQPILQIA